MKSDAKIDETGKYRYWLSRQCGSNNDDFVNFVLLNPSTADAKTDDHTIRRCRNLSKSWGYNNFYVTNLFAFRTKSPKILKKYSHPIGKENNKYIKEIAEKSKIVIVAWGNHGNWLNRDKEVLKILRVFKTPHCLGKTQTGNPIHPRVSKKISHPIKFF